MKRDSMAEQAEQRSVDYLLTAVRAAVGPIPVVGPLISELAGVVVPNQRIDRISKFVVELEQRVHNLEFRHEIVNQLKDEHFTDLLEEGIRQAARSLTDDRRRYIASLIANSLSLEQIEHAESRHLIRILDQISDVEVIWLRFYGVPTIGGDEAFLEKHKTVFDPVIASLVSSQDVLDKKTLQESYQAHLCELGLLEREYRIDMKTKQPEFDTFSGKQREQGYEITHLGRLLLRAIDLGDEGAK